MLTNRGGEKTFASRAAMPVGAAIVLSLAALNSALAGSVGDLGCARPAETFGCAMRTAGDPYIRQVPEVLGEAEKARLAERDHKWLARCRPVINRDRYGVARYYYAAPGCEFGVGAD